MSIDMDMMVKIKERPTEQELKELQYNLLHRFGRERFFIPDDHSGVEDFVKVVELNDGRFGIDLNLQGLHYEKGYERGDGLRGAMMLLHLIRAFPDAEVWYGSNGAEEFGEDLFEAYDEKKALDLLYHFVDNGMMPFLREMDEALNSEDGTVSPSCSFCRKPMIRLSMSSESAIFQCAGCRERLVLKGKKHKKWLKKSRVFVPNRSDKFHSFSKSSFERCSSAQNDLEPTPVECNEDSTERKLARRRLSDWMEIYLSSQADVMADGVINFPKSFTKWHDAINKGLQPKGL